MRFSPLLFPFKTSTNYSREVDGAGYVPYLIAGETEAQRLEAALQGLEATVRSWPR